MTLTIVAEAPCMVCGHRERGYLFYSARVNKQTIALREGFGGRPTRCAECGHPVGQQAVGVLDVESQRKVDEHRQRQGWAA